MNITLYHYIHCPFCIRVRMALGALRIPYTSKVLSYDDEITPVKLSGRKLLPIMVVDEEVVIESLDIIKRLDTHNSLYKSDLNYKAYNDLIISIDNMSKELFNLCMPAWVSTSEFSDCAREYFINKKSIKRGPFKDLYNKRYELIDINYKNVQTFENKLNPFYQSETLTINDIILSSHLWGLYSVPEFQFPNEVHKYLQLVRKLTQFDYGQDIWS